MSYATVQDLVDFAGEAEIVRNSTPDGAELAGVWDERVQPKLDTASDLMDSYFRRRYQVPVPVSPIIREHCCALARQMLATTSGTGTSESIQMGHKSAIAWLDGIGRGSVNIDGAPGVVGAEPSGARFSARPQTFDNRGALR